jgi:UDP-2,3-diacylglucosamine pyrophosphatase LpxH
MKRQRFRTVFLSDVHLGSRGCRAAELQRFLKRIDCETLYLVGDIVDFWRIRRRAYWPAEHNEVLRRILKLVHRGTRVVFIPGNHDEAIREFTGQSFGGIEIRREAVHECVDGRRLLIVHGDEYDLVVRQARLLSLVGSWAYETLIVIDRQAHRLRRRLGRREWSLAQAIKLRVKGACTFLSRFEEALAAVARSRDLDGVVCGHVHQPAAGRIGGDVAYFNCGDWIENCSALVETTGGRLQLIGRDLKPLDRRAFNAAALAEDGSAGEAGGVRPVVDGVAGGDGVGGAGAAWMPVSETAMLGEPVEVAEDEDGDDDRFPSVPRGSVRIPVAALAGAATGPGPGLGLGPGSVPGSGSGPGPRPGPERGTARDDADETGSGV